MEKNQCIIAVRKVIVFALCCLFQVSFAQAQSGLLTGKVTDEKSAPVPFANIALMQPGNTKIVAAVISDSTGAFILASPVAGKYLLRITAIGFAEQQSEEFEVKGAEFAKE